MAHCQYVSQYNVLYLKHRPLYHLAHRREAPTSVRRQFLQRDRGGNCLMLLPSHTLTFFPCKVCQISRGGQIALDICARSTGDVRRGANACFRQQHTAPYLRPHNCRLAATFYS